MLCVVDGVGWKEGNAELYVKLFLEIIDLRIVLPSVLRAFLELGVLDFYWHPIAGGHCRRDLGFVWAALERQ